MEVAGKGAWGKRWRKRIGEVFNLDWGFVI